MQQICQVLNLAGVQQDVLNNMEECFERHQNLFLGLETKHQQKKYFKEHLNLIVRPTVLCLLSLVYLPCM